MYQVEIKSFVYPWYINFIDFEEICLLIQMLALELKHVIQVCYTKQSNF